jgi:hypothetical protein
MFCNEHLCANGLKLLWVLRILEEAVRAFEERMDDVKEMNIICTYSKCVTERDGQKMDKVIFEIYLVFQILYYIPTIFID